MTFLFMVQFGEKLLCNDFSFKSKEDLTTQILYAVERETKQPPQQTAGRPAPPRVAQPVDRSVCSPSPSTERPTTPALNTTGVMISGASRRSVLSTARDDMIFLRRLTAMGKQWCSSSLILLTKVMRGVFTGASVHQNAQTKRPQASQRP